MKRLVTVFICVILLLCLPVQALAVNDVRPYLQTSRYCQSASMAANRALFLSAEQGGLAAPLTGRMVAGILYDYDGGNTSGDAAAWAVSGGIISDSATLDQGVSRLQLALMLEGYLDYADMELPEINEQYYFYDAASIDAISQSAAAAMQRGGVIIEAADGNFNPFQIVNVAEGEEILLRFFGGMRRKFMTMPAATVSAGELMDNDWFEDACFIGHSQVVGLRDYTNLTSPDYYAVIGHTVQDILNERWYKMPTGRRGTLRNSLAAGTYGKIFIMIGVNDCTDRENRAEEFREPLRQLLQIVRETQPDAAVYLISLAPVGRETKNNLWFNPDNVILYSQVIKDVSREFDAEFIDVFRFMSDDAGYMLDELNAGDGIHLIGAKYQVLADYIRTHTNTQ